MVSPLPYICLCFSLSLFFGQSLLYDSQFNISICTRLISTGYEPGTVIWNQRLLLDFVYHLSSALGCIGLNQHLLVVPL